MADVPHLDLPLRRIGRSLAEVEQGTRAEGSATVRCILSFPLGFRIERPEFGIADPEFETLPMNDAILDIQQACEVWEPSVDVVISEDPYDPRDPGAARLHINVALPEPEEEEL